MPPPSKYAIALFDGFQVLDAFGPLDVLFVLSRYSPVELSVLAPTTQPVTSLVKTRPGSIGESIVPTHTFATAPDDIEVLIVPGGAGTRETEATQPLVDLIRERFPRLRYLLTVCTGSALAARAGVLDGRNATSNKLSFDWVMTQGPEVNWIRRARWVTDGNIWTSSGISAGIDMAYAFVEDQYGAKVADDIARVQEYVRNRDPTNDPFAPA